MKLTTPLLFLLFNVALLARSAAAPLPPDAYKSAAGPFAVETVERVTLRDEKRGKDLHVFVSYPKGDGKFPVIVFSHGAGGSGDMGFPIVTHWTSHGYVVLCPTHGDSIKLRKSGGEAAGTDLRSLLGDSIGKDENNVNRPKDVSFLLDSLAELEKKTPALAGKLDRSRIGVGGHSFGAYTAQLIGGATVKLAGEEKPRSLADPRAKAILQLSGQGKDQQGLHEHSWDDFKLPMMSLTGSLDRGSQGQPPEWRRDPFAHSPPGGKYHVFIEGAHHGSFNGKMAEGGARATAGGASATNRAAATGRLQNLSVEQKAKLRERFKAKQAEKKSDSDAAPKSEAKGTALGRGGDQSAIFDWVKQATTAFWDAHLRADATATAWLKSDALPKLADGKLKLEWK